MAFQKWHEPRETPENWSFDVLARTGAGPALIAPGVTGEKVEFPTVKMRGENLFCLAVKAGRPVEVVLRNHPLAHYESLLAWDVRNSEMAKIAKGMIRQDLGDRNDPRGRRRARRQFDPARSQAAADPVTDAGTRVRCPPAAVRQVARIERPDCGFGCTKSQSV